MVTFCITARSKITMYKQFVNSRYDGHQPHGYVGSRCTPQSMELPEPIEKIMRSYLDYGNVFQIERYDF